MASPPDESYEAYDDGPNGIGYRPKIGDGIEAYAGTYDGRVSDLAGATGPVVIVDGIPN